MPKYAVNTEVSSDRSRAEIERTLIRYGASSFAYAFEPGRAAIQFSAHNRRIRFVIKLPDRNDKELTQTPTGKRRVDSAIETAYEQAVRQKWRALALVVKALLEAVDSGIVTFEDAFLPYTVLPSGMTVADEVGVQVANAYALGHVEALQIEAPR